VNHDHNNRDRTAEREPWLGVELRHLAALLAVARTGSFRRAADELGYVQSAISQQIAFLEQLVGTRVIERTRGMRGVSVTEAGEALLVHAEQIVGRFHAARADLDALANDERPVLRLGLPHGVAAGLLPPVVRQLAIDAPAVRIAPTEATREEPLLQALERGDLDAAIAELPVSSPAFTTLALRPDPHVLIVESGSRVAQIDRPLTADDLRDLPLVVHTALPGLEEHLRAGGFEPWVAFRSDSTATVEAMVAAGVGGAIVPTLALGPPMAGTVRIGVGDLVPPRTAGICWHRDRRRSAAIEAFCNAATAVQDAHAVLAEVMGDAAQAALARR
jgi:DNA-binding transcriptional LysR family regulator